MLNIFFALISFGAFAFSHNVKNFGEAKKHLSHIHSSNAVTLYCNCKYTGKLVDLKSCGYKVHKNAKRAARLEWEHVVPAHAFGQSFAEWRVGDPKCKKKNKVYKGRRCAQTNDQFALMEGDMYNLYPEIGELNGLRSNFSMAAIGTSRSPASITFGECKAVIENRKFEPMDHAKGIVARTYMYMDQAYPGKGIISDKNQKLFEAWDKMYPVTEWECRRAEMIRAIQGNENLVLKKVCIL